MLAPYQHAFIELALKNQVLRFGDFTLKSGRQSPYFFNAGLFSEGQALAQVGEAYASAIEAHFKPNDYDQLFGPAYKGIPLATTTAISLYRLHHRDVPVTFDRKEAKDHGEKGKLFGAPLEGKRALLIDDVISAGTTIRDSVQLMKQIGGTLTGIVILMNRQEKGLTSELSAVQEVEKNYGLPVASVICLEHLIEYLEKKSEKTHEDELHLKNILSYQERYGAK